MARMSVDDKVLRDPRITALAKVLNWSRRETLGCLISEVWAICYDQETHLLSARMIDLAADCVGFAKAMVECELAKPDRSGKLQIAGARERIEYLEHKRRAGRQGGLNSAESRARSAKQKSPRAQAVGNPPVPDPVPDPSPVPVPDPVPPPAPVPAPKKASPGGSVHRPAVEAFHAYFMATNGGAKPTWDETRISMVKTLVRKHGVDEVVRCIGILRDSPPEFPPQPWDLGTFVRHFDKCRAAPQQTLGVAQSVLRIARGEDQ